MSGQHKYLTVSEAAEIIRCSERFVKDELRRKNLRGLKTGAGWRLTEPDIDTYMATRANVRPVRRSA